MVGLNLFVSASAFILALGFLLFFIDAIRSARSGKPAGQSVGGVDARMGDGIAAAAFNFAHIPVVDSGEPLWRDEYAVARDCASTAAN
jgi:heme/copper-type cytochrome/quinol oxidase subunit 1